MVDITNTRGNTIQKNHLTLQMYMGPSKNKTQTLFLTVFLLYPTEVRRRREHFLHTEKVEYTLLSRADDNREINLFLLPYYSHLQQGTSTSNAPSPCVCRKRSNYFPFWKFAHTHTFGILGILNNLNWPENKTQNFVSNITRFCSCLKCF